MDRFNDANIDRDTLWDLVDKVANGLSLAGEQGQLGSPPSNKDVHDFDTRLSMAHC